MSELSVTTPLQVLIDAKLAGTKATSISPSPDWFGEYIFRSNEQAAEVAIEALAAKGYVVVRKHDVWAAAQLLQGEAAAREVPEPNLVTRLREAAQ